MTSAHQQHLLCGEHNRSEISIKNHKNHKNPTTAGSRERELENVDVALMTGEAWCTGALQKPQSKQAAGKNWRNDLACCGVAHDRLHDGAIGVAVAGLASEDGEAAEGGQTLITAKATGVGLCGARALTRPCLARLQG